MTSNPTARGTPGHKPVRDHLRRWFSKLVRRSPANSGGIAHIGRPHIYILPTGAGLVFGGVLALMLLGSLNYQNNLALLFTFLMASMAIVGMFHTWLNLLDLKVSVRGGPPVFAGQEGAFGFSLQEDRARNRGDLRVRIGAWETAPVNLERDESGTLSISVPAPRRGWLMPEEIRVETRYPLGLFRAWCYPQTAARVRVYPRPAARGPVPVPLPACHPSKQGDLGSGTDDFVGPRDYRHGDSPRRLDWKALARERGLVVKQFGGDRAAQVWFDWDRLPTAGIESRLGLLCRQVLDADRNGLSYGLSLPGSTVPMGHGEVHKHRCLEALSDFGHAEKN